MASRPKRLEGWHGFVRTATEWGRRVAACLLGICCPRHGTNDLKNFLVLRFYESTEVLNVLGETIVMGLTVFPALLWSVFLGADASLSEPWS